MVTFTDAGQALARLEGRAKPLVAVLLALACASCSRKGSDSELERAKAEPSAAASARPPEPAAAVPSAVPPAAPSTPKVPPQLVACGERDFYRITKSSLQVFEIAAELPPPHIRGSRVARQVNEVAAGEPTNVVTLARNGALVVAKDAVLRYELGKKEARRDPAIEARPPLVVGADPRGAGSFVVHSAGEGKLRKVTLGGAKGGREVVEALPGFDGRLFTLLTDGTALFSTSSGLLRTGRASVRAPFPELSAPVTVLFADAATDRYWAADASGRVGLWDAKQSASPLATANVAGVVIDTAVEGERVAVLGVALDGASYRPAVTVFSAGKEQARLSIGPSVAPTQPELDLCLVAGRPWVVVGSRRWLQLLDWESRRLLAEW